jgi:hypothetical protein
MSHEQDIHLCHQWDQNRLRFTGFPEARTEVGVKGDPGPSLASQLNGRLAGGCARRAEAGVMPECTRRLLETDLVKSCGDKREAAEPLR